MLSPSLAEWTPVDHPVRWLTGNQTPDHATRVALLPGAPRRDARAAGAPSIRVAVGAGLVDLAVADAGYHSAAALAQAAAAGYAAAGWSLLATAVNLRTLRRVWRALDPTGRAPGAAGADRLTGPPPRRPPRTRRTRRAPPRPVLRHARVRTRFCDRL